MIIFISVTDRCLSSVSESFLKKSLVLSGEDVRRAPKVQQVTEVVGVALGQGEEPAGSAAAARSAGTLGIRLFQTL